MKTARSDVQIFNVNPAMAEKIHRSYITKYKLVSNDVAAINPVLPYSDAAFDIVLDCVSSIYRADSMFGLSREDANLQKLEEVVRVLKPGGFAAVGPLIRDEEIDEFIENSKKIGGIDITKGRVIELNFQSFWIKKHPL